MYRVTRQQQQNHVSSLGSKSLNNSNDKIENFDISLKPRYLIVNKQNFIFF